MAKADPQDKDNRIQFSNKLRELLNLRNKKQIDLHRDLGIPKSTITGYVKGTSLPNPETSQKIADYFNVPRSELDPRFKPHRDPKEDDEKPLTRNQKLIAYSIDPDISDEERQAIIEMVQAAKKFRRRI